MPSFFTLFYILHDIYKLVSIPVAALICATSLGAGAADCKSAVPAAERFQLNAKAQPTATLPAPRHEASGKATRDEVCGYYNFDSFRLTRAFQGWERSYCLPIVMPGEGPDDLILYGFWADFDYDGTPISEVHAKFDQEAQTITIPAGTCLGTYGDYTSYIYVSDWNTDIMLDEPIVLNYDQANKGMTYYCEPNAAGNAPVSCLIVTSYPDAVGQHITQGVDFIAAIEMYKYNGSMTLTDATHVSSGEALVYIDPTAGGFTVRNFGNRGYRIPLDFTADLEAGTCTAQPTLCHKDFKFDDGRVMDLHFASTNGTAITGTIAKKEGEENLYVVNIPSWSLYNMADGKAMVEYKDTYLTVPLGDSSGVETPVADATEAPAEYFTLQGVRVDNPRPGTVVICRRGDKVSKILVK